jgi:hypothetical protein
LNTTWQRSSHRTLRSASRLAATSCM